MNRSEIEEIVKEVVEPVVAVLEKNLELVDKKLEQQDKLTANLLKGFFEMNSALEQTIHQLIGDDEDKQEQFRQQLNTRYKEHLKMIQEMSNAAAASSDPEEVIESVWSMVGRNKSS